MSISSNSKYLADIMNIYFAIIISPKLTAPSISKDAKGN